MAAWHEFEMGGTAAALRDPSFEALRATDFADYRDENGDIPEWFPVILQLAVPATQFAVGNWIVSPPAGWQSWIRVPWIYAYPPAKVGALTFCTATVKRKFFQQLRFNSALRQTVVRFELCLPLSFDTDAVIPPPPPEPMIIRPSNVVITGIIDDGLAYAHEHFRLPDGSTRVEYFWDQNASSTATPGFGYGRELAKFPDLHNPMVNANHAGLVDEDQVYQQAGLLDYGTSGHKGLGRRAAHGTHVMHAASALQPGDVANERPLVCVQLPTRAVADTSGTSLARHIFDGLVYILKRTDRISRARAVELLSTVVNVSFGNIAGPHDGSSILEAAIEELITLRSAGPQPGRLAVVFPSGNAHLARCHARFRLTPARPSHRLEWRIQPDDATPSSMQLWPRRLLPLPEMRVRVQPPGGGLSPWIDPGETFAWYDGADALCAVTNLSGATTGARPVAHVWVAPTVTHHPTRNTAPSGVWRVEVRRQGIGPSLPVWAWIQRDDRPFGYPRRGRQSRFEHAAFRYRDRVTGRHVEADDAGSHMQRGGLMNAFATGAQTVAVGGYRSSDWRIWKQSAGGPLPIGTEKPEALAASEDSVANRGRLAAGTRSNSMVAMNGTSVAAPQVANFLVGLESADVPAGPGPVMIEAAVQEAYYPRPPLAASDAQRTGAGRIAWPRLQRFRRFER